MKERKWKGLILLFIFLAISFLFKQFQGGYVSGFLFYSVLFLFLFEGILAISTKGPIKVKREIVSSRLTAGEELRVWIEVAVPVWLPFLWIAVEDHLPPKLQLLTEENRYWQLAGFRRRISFGYEIEKMPRGEFHFGPVSVQMGDLFGFFQRKVTLHFPQTVLVYPVYQEVAFFPSVYEKNTGLQFAINRTAEDPTSVLGIRDYVIGDKLSRIHWKASAKTGQLKTKEFEYPANIDFMLFVDCEERNYRGAAQLFERAVSGAASLAKYALDNQFRCGLAVLRGEETVIPLARHREQMIRIFGELARLEADSKVSFAQFLIRQISSLPSGTTAMVVTPRVTAELVRALSLVRQNKFSVELFWVRDDHEELGEFSSLLAREGVRVHILNEDGLLASLKGVEDRENIS